MRSRLGTHFMAFFRLIAYFNVSWQKVPYFSVSRQKVPYFNISRQKVPYFNVSRQNRVLFNCFATKQCWGMLKMWGQPLFCNQPSTTATYLLLCISFMNNSQTKSPGYNKMQLRLIVSMSSSLWLPLALSGSLWLSLARCPALSGSLWLAARLSLAPSGSLRLFIALQICLPSPCSAHKALARLTRPLLSSERRSWVRTL